MGVWLPSLPVDPDPGWENRAACRAAVEAGEAEPDWWFPTRDGPGAHPEGVREQTDAAIAICKSCPVRFECLGLAFSLGRVGAFGVWGGLRENERRRMRRRARSVA